MRRSRVQRCKSERQDSKGDREPDSWQGVNIHGRRRAAEGRGVASRLPADAEGGDDAPAMIRAAVGRLIEHTRVLDPELAFQLMAVEVPIETEVEFVEAIALSRRQLRLIAREADAVYAGATDISITEDRLPFFRKRKTGHHLNTLEIRLRIAAFGVTDIDPQGPGAVTKEQAERQGLLMITGKGVGPPVAFS